VGSKHVQRHMPRCCPVPEWDCATNATCGNEWKKIQFVTCYFSVFWHSITSVRTSICNFRIFHTPPFTFPARTAYQHEQGHEERQQLVGGILPISLELVIFRM
jgi:hypothetical protein